ncbi:MAG: tryptophan--tRNA ligase, partial [Bacteroidales bacterium]|nr:tryptophan--tRNA ligase [Bacteroidales bacterium]
EKKVKRALTDSGPTEPNSVMPDYIENLFTIMRVVSTEEVVNHYEEKWNSCEIRYGDMKKQLATDIISVTTPIRKRILELEKDNDYLRKVANEGAERSRANAAKTIGEVRNIMGFKGF